MFMSSTDAARELGVSERQVRRLVEGGQLTAERVGGRYALYENDVFSRKRVKARGRNWSINARKAALDFLATGRTERIEGSQRSRLKARLRAMEVGELANRLLAGDVAMFESGKPSQEMQSDIASELGLVDTRTKTLVTERRRRAIASHRLTPNPNGNVAVIEGEYEHRRVLEALVLYSHGDDRERAAAEQWLADLRRAL